MRTACLPRLWPAQKRHMKFIVVTLLTRRWFTSCEIGRSYPHSHLVWFIVILFFSEIFSVLLRKKRSGAQKKIAHLGAIGTTNTIILNWFLPGPKLFATKLVIFPQILSPAVSVPIVFLGISNPIDGRFVSIYRTILTSIDNLKCDTNCGWRTKIRLNFYGF